MDHVPEIHVVLQVALEVTSPTREWASIPRRWRGRSNRPWMTPKASLDIRVWESPDDDVFVYRSHSVPYGWRPSSWYSPSGSRAVMRPNSFLRIHQPRNVF